jgi:hypothetical protein
VIPLTGLRKELGFSFPSSLGRRPALWRPDEARFAGYMYGLVAIRNFRASNLLAQDISLFSNELKVSALTEIKK